MMNATPYSTAAALLTSPYRVVGEEDSPTTSDYLNTDFPGAADTAVPRFSPDPAMCLPPEPVFLPGAVLPAQAMLQAQAMLPARPMFPTDTLLNPVERFGLVAPPEPDWLPHETPRSPVESVISDIDWPTSEDSEPCTNPSQVEDGLIRGQKRQRTSSLRSPCNRNQLRPRKQVRFDWPLSETLVFDSKTYCSEPPLPPAPVKEDDDSDCESDEGEEATEECINVAAGYFQTSDIPASQCLTQTQKEKMKWYVDPGYELMLASKNVFMSDCSQGISDESMEFLNRLRHKPVLTATGRSYEDAIYNESKRAQRDLLEGKPPVVQDQDNPQILLPSVKRLAADDTRLLALAESTNEPWTSCLPLVGHFPQPSYAVGFNRDAFTASELAKLSAAFGDPVTGQPSVVLATHNMYFSFLTCEVRTGDAWLNMADRQNAHSAAISVGGVVELFRAAGCAHEIDRTILAFSISHDQKVMRIYAHYPVITDDKTEYFRLAISGSDITPRWSYNIWTAYQFFMNMYDMWTPNHLARLRRAINQLPLPPKPEAAYADTYYPAVPQAVVSQAAVPQAVTPQAAMSRAVTSRAAVPRAVTSRASIPQAATSRAAVPHASTPRAVLSQAVVPHPAVPQAVVPQGVVPRSAAPQAVVSRTAVPHSATPQAAMPRAAVPQAVKSRAIISHAPAPQAAGSQAAVTQAVVSRAVIPHSTAPQTVMSLATVPHAATPQVVISRAVFPQAATPQAVAPQAVMSRATASRAAAPLAAMSQVAVPHTVVPHAVVSRAAIPHSAAPQSAISQAVAPYDAASQAVIPHAAAPRADMTRAVVPHPVAPRAIISQPVSPSAAASRTDLSRAVDGPVRQLLPGDLYGRFDFCFSGLTDRLQRLQRARELEGLQGS